MHAMKKLIFLLSLAMISLSSLAQFEGSLNYEDDFSNAIEKGKIITTFYETKTKARIESKSIPVKNGSPDTSAAKSQNVHLFDFAAQKETTLLADRKMATVTGFTTALMEQATKLTDADITIQKLGVETVGQYSCTHFVIMVRKGKHDVWITNKLGTSNIFYIGPYLYYPEGSLVAKKLIDAGGNGVVVKWQVGNATGTLTGAQSKSVDPSLFQPPKDYTVLQRDFPVRQ